MKRFRSIRIRNYVLPLLLGALALRFLIPDGFMPDSRSGTVVRVGMCSEVGKSELLEIPGEPVKPHCDHCTAPSMAAPLSPYNFTGPVTVPQRSLLPWQESEISGVALVRAQIPRAPPAA